MLKIFATLVRGAAADAEQAVFDANAIRILEQQLRDAAGALELSRKELACVMAHRAAEDRARQALDSRIAELEQSGSASLDQAREDLAREIATVIAATEDERGERAAAVTRLDCDIARLRRLSDDGSRRLGELRRGLETARAQEALRRAGANGRRALASGTGALREAEATLAKIRDNHLREEDVAEASEALEREISGRNLDERLAAAGLGPNPKTRADDVLARLRQRNAATAAPKA